jgi:hypothetical protein
MASWSDLGRELDRWAGEGLTATLWWRDDDAAKLTPEIERLVALAGAFGVPLHLAAIPLDLSDALVAALKGSANVRVLQHGYAHVDHAPRGAGSWELGDHRPQAGCSKSWRSGLPGSRRPSGTLPAGSCAAVDPHRSRPRSGVCRASDCAPVDGGRAAAAVRRPGRGGAQCPLRSDQVEGGCALHRHRAGARRDRRPSGRPPTGRCRHCRADRPVHPPPGPRRGDMGVRRGAGRAHGGPRLRRAGSASKPNWSRRRRRADGALGGARRARAHPALPVRQHGQDPVRALGQHSRLPLDPGGRPLWRGGHGRRRVVRLPRHRVRRPPACRHHPQHRQHHLVVPGEGPPAQRLGQEMLALVTSLPDVTYVATSPNPRSGGLLAKVGWEVFEERRFVWHRSDDRPGPKCAGLPRRSDAGELDADSRRVLADHAGLNIDRRMSCAAATAKPAWSSPT